MITKNFKAVCQMILQAKSGTSHYGMLPITFVDGTTYYLSPRFSRFPYTVTDSSLSANMYSNGIGVGSGNNPASENDYDLQSRLSDSDIACTVTSALGIDEANPYLEFTLQITNKKADAISVAEVGYFQGLQCTSTQGGTSASGKNFCLDRTVLETPVTIPAGQTKTIKYRLKTVV